MKKVLLALIVASSFSATVIAGENITPERVAIYKTDSGYQVSGYNSGSAYANAMSNMLNKSKNERLSSAKSEEERQKITLETKYNIDRYKKHGEFADRTIKYLKSGMKMSAAKEKAASEIYQNNFNDTYNPNDPSTSYNADSKTDSIISGGGSSVGGENFKQFNELDCSFDEVSNYIDKSNNPKSKALSLPNYSTTFKDVATKSASKIQGKEEAECQTIFDDVDFNKLDDLSIDNLLDKIPTFGEFGNKLKGLGSKAADQTKDLAATLGGTLKEGFCKRLSSEYVGDLAGDLINDKYQEGVDGTLLDGTKLSGLDKKSNQENFTYKILKNQTNISDSNLIKALDVTRKDNVSQVGDFVEDQLNDQLDNLEDQIFG